MFIPDPDPYFFNPSRIADPAGVKKVPDPGSGAATLRISCKIIIKGIVTDNVVEPEPRDEEPNINCLTEPKLFNLGGS
jgi:hypothetical protein